MTTTHTRDTLPVLRWLERLHLLYPSHTDRIRHAIDEVVEVGAATYTPARVVSHLDHRLKWYEVTRQAAKILKARGYPICAEVCNPNSRAPTSTMVEPYENEAAFVDAIEDVAWQGTGRPTKRVYFFVALEPGQAVEDGLRMPSMHDAEMDASQ